MKRQTQGSSPLGNFMRKLLDKHKITMGRDPSDENAIAIVHDNAPSTKKCRDPFQSFVANRQKVHIHARWGTSREVSSWSSFGDDQSIFSDDSWGAPPPPPPRAFRLNKDGSESHRSTTSDQRKGRQKNASPPLGKVHLYRPPERHTIKPRLPDSLLRRRGSYD